MRVSLNFHVPTQECSTFELVIVVSVTHEPLCVQMEVSIEIFIDFDSL